MESLGIKETKELLIVINELSIVLIKHVKDGFDFSDIPAIASDLIQDSAFREAVVSAVSGVAQVPSELKDLSATEGLELAKVQIEYLPKILAALKKI